MSVAGTELPTSALQRFRAESKGQLTFGGRDREVTERHYAFLTKDELHKGRRAE